MFKDIHTRPLRNDRLLVTATLQQEGKEDVEVRTFGWQSALTNHYDDTSIDEESGQRKDSAKPRPMTPDEEQSYYTRLLTESIPQEGEE